MPTSPHSRRQVDQVRLALSQLPAATPLQKVFALACEQSAETLSIARVGIWLFVEQRTALLCVNLYEWARDEHSVGAILHVADYPNYFAALTLRKSVPAEVAIEDPRTAELAHSYMGPLGIGSMLDAGLFVGGELVGVICNEHVGLPRKFTTEECDFASSIADLVAARIQSAELAEYKAAFRTQEYQLLAGEKAEALAQMAAGVAHDFNNILMIIAGHADLLRELPNLPDMGQTYLHPIIDASNRGRALIRELVSFAKPEKESVPTTVVDLTDVLNDFLPMIRSAMGHFHRVEYEQATARALVLVNRTQFCRIVFNLAINARDAMKDGGAVKLRLSSAAIDDRLGQRRHYVQLEVKDTGIGMDEDTLKHIGEPYFTTKTNGTGLGVAIVQKNVDRAGGVLRIESQPGQGTTVRVFLPRVGSATGDTEEIPIPKGL